MGHLRWLSQLRVKSDPTCECSPDDAAGQGQPRLPL